MLTVKQLKQFQEITKHALGIDLSDEEALEQGIKLLCILDLVVKEIERSVGEEPKSKE